MLQHSCIHLLVPVNKTASKCNSTQTIGSSGIDDTATTHYLLLAQKFLSTTSLQLCDLSSGTFLCMLLHDNDTHGILWRHHSNHAATGSIWSSWLYSGYIPHRGDITIRILYEVNPSNCGCFTSNQELWHILIQSKSVPIMIQVTIVLCTWHLNPYRNSQNFCWAKISRLHQTFVLAKYFACLNFMVDLEYGN